MLVIFITHQISTNDLSHSYIKAMGVINLISFRFENGCSNLVEWKETDLSISNEFCERKSFLEQFHV